MYGVEALLIWRCLFCDEKYLYWMVILYRNDRENDKTGKGIIEY